MIVLPLVTDGSVGADAPDQGVLVSYKDSRLAGHRDRPARHRPVRPRRHLGGGNSGHRQGDADLGGLVQRAAQRRAVAAAADPRRGEPEYRWPAAEPGDRLGVHRRSPKTTSSSYVVLPDGVAKVNDTTAAALRATNSYGLIAPPSVESSDGREDRRAGLRLAAARRAAGDPAARGRPDAVLGVAARTGRPGARRPP